MARTRLKKPVSWLPIDSRIIPDILAFGHVRGLARVFLTIEITTSVFVVTGTFIVVILKLLGLD